MAQTFDPYRALGVRRDASDADVKAAHRKLAKRFHPDAENGDKDRFLRVQEAYKVLTDPLLRREWDARHAPGPMRADRPSPGAARASGAAGAAAGSRPRAPRRPARPQRPAEPARGADGESRGTQSPDGQDSAAHRPRSSRAYTWSAAEVPWWEEGTSDSRRQPGRRRPAHGPTPNAADTQASPPPPAEPPAGAPNPFDVYNRSSGAAWSMAARAYFRRGDQELPRRGTFQYEGTQVLTGARARTHAEAEARRRAAEATREPAAAAAAPGPSAFTYTASGVSRDAHRIHQVRQAWRRRTNAAAWPTLRERLLYALLAWIPAALVIGYGGALATDCTGTGSACPAYLETIQALAIALVLGVLAALPKVAYVGAMSAIGALFVGLAVVGVMAVANVELPLSMELTALFGGALAVGYAATAAIVVIRKPGSRPWFTGARP